MNISTLAKKVNLHSDEMRKKIVELGYRLRPTAKKISDKKAKEIIKKMQQIRKQEKIAEEEKKSQEVEAKKPKKIFVPQTVSVKDFSEILELEVTEVIKKLMQEGIMATINEEIDFETASIIAEELGYKIELKKEKRDLVKEKGVRKKILEDLATEEKANLKSRPPVVVVMGHVDHGKTKLLDAIRKANIIDTEAGGITQHIGAYQVTTHDRLITFLDTPGHEAFKAMRSRGGQIADVAILVVAADDGLQPQTLESISVIQKEKLPFIIAINKIDKENADVEKVKQQLSEINLVPEDWGGQTVCHQISAKKQEGITELLDLILLIADMKELKADDTGLAIGTIIESHIDKGEGPVATVLVQAGILKIGDLFIVGDVSGKIKTLKDWKGQDVQQATPATPVKILGLKKSPSIGEILEVVGDKKEFKSRTKNLNGFQAQVKTVSSQNSDENQDINILNLIIKSDVLGSAEAIEESLNNLKIPETKVKVIKKGLGQITETDILNAASANAIVIGFHIKENKNVQILAEDKNVTVLYFDIIYKLLEDIELRLKKIKAKKIVHKLLGKLEVLAIFKTSKNSVILGGKVTNGKITKPAKIKVIRQGEIETVGDLVNLQAAKENVTEVVEGSEVGLEYHGDPIIQVGDTLEFFEEIYE